MKVHVKKCWPEAFQAVRDGSKPFEWRREDDCRYAINDLLVLLEWVPEPFIDHGADGWPEVQRGYTGEVEKRRVSYVLRERFGVPDGYVVLGLAPVTDETKERPDER